MVCVTALATIGTIEAPTVTVGAVSALAAVGLFVAIKGWWTRAYVVTILMMCAGASAIPSVVAIGTYGKIAAVLFLLVVTLVTTAGRRGEYVNKKHLFLMWSLWAVAILAPVSVIWSQSPIDTVLDGGTTVVLVLVLHRVGTIRWQDRAFLIRDISTAYWATTSVLFLGLLLAFANVSGAIRSNGRHQGLFSNPNLLGAIAAIVLAVGIGVAIHRKSALVWASLAIPVAAIVLSQSRTALLAALVGVTWAVLRGGFARIIPLAAAAVGGLVVLELTGLGVLGDSLDRFVTDGGDPLSGRTYVWAETWWSIQSHPMGVGWAANPTALESYYRAGLTQTGLLNSHNSWLQMLNELGWLGVVPILMLLVALIWITLTARVEGIGTGFVALSATGFLIHFTESVAFGVGQPYPYLFWFGVLAAAVYSGPKRERVSRHRTRSLRRERSKSSRPRARSAA